MARAEHLVVALLAAGASARFGDDDKLLASLGDRRLIDWAASTGRSVAAQAHVVIVSPHFPRDQCPIGYRLLVNDAASEGLGSSLRMAAREARLAAADALLVLLGDMPLVGADHLAALLEAYAVDRPVFTRRPDSHGSNGRGQPPALLPAALFPALEALGGDKGARDIAGNALFIAAPSEALLDVDRPADLAHCRVLLGL